MASIEVTVKGPSIGFNIVANYLHQNDIRYNISDSNPVVFNFHLSIYDAERFIVHLESFVGKYGVRVQSFNFVPEDRYDVYIWDDDDYVGELEIGRRKKIYVNSGGW